MGPVQPTHHEYLRHVLATPDMRGDGSPHPWEGAIEGRNPPFWLTWFRIVGYEPGLRTGGLAYELRFHPYRDAHSVPTTLHPPDPTIRAATSFKFPSEYTHWQLLTQLHGPGPPGPAWLSDPNDPLRGLPIPEQERQRLQLAVRLELGSGRWHASHSPRTHPPDASVVASSSALEKIRLELDQLARYLGRFRCPGTEDTSEPASPQPAPPQGPPSPGRVGPDALRWGGPDHPAFDEPVDSSAPRPPTAA